MRVCLPLLLSSLPRSSRPRPSPPRRSILTTASLLMSPALQMYVPSSREVTREKLRAPRPLSRTWGDKGRRSRRDQRARGSRTRVEPLAGITWQSREPDPPSSIDNEERGEILNSKSKRERPPCCCFSCFGHICCKWHRFC